MIFLANVAESLGDSASLLDQRRSFSLVLTSRGATRLQKLTASERRTYEPKVSAIWLAPNGTLFGVSRIPGVECSSCLSARASVCLICGAVGTLKSEGQENLHWTDCNKECCVA